MTLDRSTEDPAADGERNQPHQPLQSHQPRRSPLPLFVGAYAALPADAAGRTALLDGLHRDLGATGLEIPTQHLLSADGGSTDGITAMLRGRFTQCAVTAIPGTMQRLAADPTFGLASRDPDGRAAALEYVRALRRAAREVDEATGEPSIVRLHIQSAPSGAADPSALARSLEALNDGGDGGGHGDHGTSGPIDLVLEHCDAANDRVAGEKRFLPLSEEIRIAGEAGIGLAINWGRSAVETHDAATPREHIEEAAASGLLRGVMFSGAGAPASGFGPAWADAHLPLTADEPTSLLDEAEVRRCLEAAGGLEYAGVKVQAPSGADVETRLAIIRRVLRTIRDR